MLDELVASGRTPSNISTFARPWFFLPSTLFAWIVDTIEETYNMDPPLSIYPKKSPYTTYYHGFLLGSLPCNLPRYRVPLTEVYRVTFTSLLSCEKQVLGRDIQPCPMYKSIYISDWSLIAIDN
jgi:hypothetical protein